MSSEIPEAKIAKVTVVEPSTSGKAIASLILGLSSIMCMFVTGLAAIILGVISLSDINKSGGRIKGSAMAIIGIITGSLGCLWTIPILIALLLPAVQATREAARQVTAMNKMRGIALAMHNYHDANQKLPSAMPDPSDSNQQDSQLSWRVKILPYLEHGDLFRQFHHDEPWDSPHNLTLVEKMPEWFKSLSHPLEPGKTIYVVPTSQLDATGQPDRQTETIFGPGRSLSFGSMSDGSSNTILILEVDPEAAVIWTKPEDWEFDPANPHRGLGNARPGIFLTGMADGSSKALDDDIDPELLKSMFTPRAGD